jgi:hypothetical protein
VGLVKRPTKTEPQKLKLVLEHSLIREVAYTWTYSEASGFFRCSSCLAQGRSLAHISCPMKRLWEESGYTKMRAQPIAAL